jgi:transposase-like protein
MSKYSKAFKLKIIKQCLSGRDSSRRLGALHQIEHSLIRRWIRVYLAHGIKAFDRPRVHYSTAFKLSVIASRHRQGLSLSQAAIRYNIPAVSTVASWQKLYNQGGSTALDPRPRGRTAMPGKLKPFKPTNKPPQEMTQAELIREVQYRRAETAYLKKLEAVLQARESSSEPKPK